MVLVEYNQQGDVQVLEINKEKIKKMLDNHNNFYFRSKIVLIKVTKMSSLDHLICSFHLI